MFLFECIGAFLRVCFVSLRFFAVFCGYLRAKTGKLNEFLLFLSINGYYCAL